MNKFLLLCLISVISACAAPSLNDSDSPRLASTEEVSQAMSKPPILHALPEGVISLDVVNVADRLHLLLGEHHHGQKTLWYQSSEDGGRSWTQRLQVMRQEPLAVNIDRGKDAQITALGSTIVVAWMEYVENARFHAGPMRTALSTDAGKSWRYAASPPDWKPGPHSYLDLSSGRDRLHAVWLDSRAGRSEVKASQALYYASSDDGGASWHSNQTLDGLTCSCCWNTMKTDAAGDTYVLYRDKQPSDFSLGVIKPGHPWLYLGHVGDFNWQFDGCPHIGGGLDFQTTDGEERLHAAVGTRHPTHAGVHYLFSTNHGLSWSAPLPMGDQSAVHADIAAHDDGRVVLVWDMMSDTGLAVFLAESADRGQHWQPLRRISAPGRRATHPRVVKTASGFFVAWTEHDGSDQYLGRLVL